jgi:hypothetical protein
MKYALMALVIGTVGLGAGFGSATLATGSETTSATCESVVASFKTTFPAVYAQAGSPTITCLDDPTWGGAGGTNCYTGHIDINARLSAMAKAANVKNLEQYWRITVAHEMGHMWECHNAGGQPGAPMLDSRSVEYAQIRGFTRPLPLIQLYEDYATTFTDWLGIFTSKECYAPAPAFCFKNEAGKPTPSQLANLRQAGMLPAKH